MHGAYAGWWNACRLRGVGVVRGGRGSWWDDDGLPEDLSGADPTSSGTDAPSSDDRDITVTGSERQQLSSGLLDDDFIDLGERPHVGTGARERSGTEERPARRPLPRRLLALAALGLVTVGFVGGLAVGRSSRLDPTTKATPDSETTHVVVLPSTMWWCEPYQYDHSHGKAPVRGCPTAGRIQSITGTSITLETVDGTSLTVIGVPSTRVVGVKKLADLRSGQHIEVQAVQINGELVARRITVE